MKPEELIKECQDKISSLSNLIPVKQYQMRLDELDSLIPSLDWGNSKSVALMKERQKLSDTLEKLKKFKDQISFYQECLTEMPEELNGMTVELNSFHQQVVDFEFQNMMKDPLDNNPAILSINAGAGGLEAANWVSMLLRMYLRYAEANGFKTEILDFKPSEEHSAICTDSVSIRIEGDYAFGFLKGESGVHRLIRNSPFNAGDARHTSFAAVSVIPDIEDTIDIKIEEKDLDIQATRSGGSGGQAVNKISSCIILKHLPTGIMIRSQTESSQHENRRIAMKILKAKLYDLEMKKRKAEQDKHAASMSDVSFGNQIRTYTESPYSLVKDHRTGFEINDFDKALDGNIQGLILSLLKSKAR